MKEQEAEFNSCASLTDTQEFRDAKETYAKIKLDKEDPFAHMLMMQKGLQVALSASRPCNAHPDELVTVGQKFDWLRENKQAFDDEYREIIDALPGMSLEAKDRSAVWKKWKAKHEDIRGRTFDDLTEADIHELKFELVDSFHFFMNMFFALDMSAEELFTYYFAKNAENYRRVKASY